MYSDIKGVQILVSLLKQYNIKHLVLSPGTRNTALVHSVETDDFFHCYSIVDERSAGFVALGLAEALDEPVCVSCTAATASTNYMPAIKEAYERNIQLVALTADQDMYGMFNMEDQTINQVDMFHGFIRYAVDVPMIRNNKDEWYFTRCVNEALLETNHHIKGPVQINYRMAYSLDDIASFTTDILPTARKIDRYYDDCDWEHLRSILLSKNRILVVGGSYLGETEELSRLLEEFSNRYNCVILNDSYANQRGGKILNPLAFGEVALNESLDEYCPDVIISFGNVFYATSKSILPQYAKSAVHWQIAEDGMINDGFRCLRKVFECKPETFFKNILQGVKTENNNNYYKIWSARLAKFKFPELGFTNFYVIKEFTSRVSAGSILHTSVLDAIRISNYTTIDRNVLCFANIGADGIDGALSTYLGQARSTDKLAFLLIGDLSFLYDMNALRCELPSNSRILVINNYAGAEFHKNFGLTKIPTLNLHIAAGHITKIQQCAKIAKAQYISASNQTELEDGFRSFFSENHNAPIIFEVFTDAATDANTLKEYWKLNKSATIKGKVKERIKGIIGEERAKKIKKFVKR